MKRHLVGKVACLGIDQVDLLDGVAHRPVGVIWVVGRGRADLQHADKGNSGVRNDSRWRTATRRDAEEAIAAGGAIRQPFTLGPEEAALILCQCQADDRHILQRVAVDQHAGVARVPTGRGVDRPDL